MHDMKRNFNLEHTHQVRCVGKVQYIYNFVLGVLSKVERLATDFPVSPGPVI